MNIVLVEDNTALSFAAATVLKKHGHGVTVFASAEMLIDALPDGAVDLFILDINLPNMDGFALMELLRPYFETGDFIFISSYADMRHISRAFSLGCEDYLKKPFEIGELLLRVDKVARRRSVTGTALLSEHCVFHIDDRQLLIDGMAVGLTQKEGSLLEMLVRNRMHVVSHDAIAERVWGEETSRNTIASVVRRLRKKLGADLIESIREQGYRLR